MSIKKHHGAHPISRVKPNTAVNTNPGQYKPKLADATTATRSAVTSPTRVKLNAPVEKASININPSLPGPVGVDPDARLCATATNSKREIGDAADVSNPDSPDYDPTDPNYDSELDDSDGDEADANA